MYVIDQARPEPAAIPGISHATWAGHDDGVAQLSLWRQSMAPGAATPPHRHDCDEVVLCEAGEGEVTIDGVVHRFRAGQTIVLPKGLLHQIFNTGTVTMETLGIFGASPVGTTLPDGAALQVPWRT